MDGDFIQIGEDKIGRGEEKQVNVYIARLPTRNTIEIPVVVSRSKKEGPVLLICGGIHGDEINGIEIVRRILVNGYNKPLIGSTITIPTINIYGFIQLAREVPGGKDINRSFPGSRTGSLASRLAYHLRQDILPQVDCVIDFHTGGNRINNYPQIRTRIKDEEDLNMAKAFSPKFLVNADLREKSFRKEASKMNKPFLLFEGGESLRLQKHTIDVGINGTLRLMKHLGMREDAPAPKFDPIIIEDSFWIRAKTSGLHHSLARVGAQVEKGDIIGKITDPFGDFETPVKSAYNGFIIAVNNQPVINRGDALFHVGSSQ